MKITVKLYIELKNKDLSKSSVKVSILTSAVIILYDIIYRPRSKVDLTISTISN